MQWLEQEGVFQALPIEGGVRTYEGKPVVAVEIKFKITDAYDAQSGQFESWLDRDVWVSGRFFIVGKDGKPNQFACRSLRASFGWDGTFGSLQTMQAYRDRPVQLTVENEEYNGSYRYRVAFLNNVDRPADGSAGNCDADAVRTLDMLHGPAFRALLGAAAPQPGANDLPGGFVEVPAIPPAEQPVQYDLSGEASATAPVSDPGPSDRMVEAFREVGVTLEMIECLLDKPVAKMDEKEAAAMRKIYAAIKGGEAVSVHFPVVAPTGGRIPF